MQAVQHGCQLHMPLLSIDYVSGPCLVQAGSDVLHSEECLLQGQYTECKNHHWSARWHRVDV